MNGESCCGGSEHVSSSGTAAEAAGAPPVPAVVDRAVFQAELDRLRLREKAHTREGDAIAAAHGRPIAQWSRLEAGRSDELAGG
jgi:hypothetical protein